MCGSCSGAVVIALDCMMAVFAWVLPLVVLGLDAWSGTDRAIVQQGTVLEQQG